MVQNLPVNLIYAKVCEPNAEIITFVPQNVLMCPSAFLSVICIYISSKYISITYALVDALALYLY
jgi:hypothetical protein